MLLLAALRTREALRPFHGYKILGTGRFRAKFLLKFQYCFGVGIHSATLPVVATLVKGIAQFYFKGILTGEPRTFNLHGLYFLLK